MKVMSFTYTKPGNLVSHRVLAALSQPSPNVFGIDITELEPLEQASFEVELAEMLAQHKVEMEMLMADYDIVNNYRSFVPERMSNIV